MKMITGFLSPTSGSASIEGHDVINDPLEAKRLLGYLPESGPLYEEMTVIEFLDFIAELRDLSGSKAESAKQRVIKLCHLEGVLFQTIETLSKGYRQRVGMAQAIIHNPPYLIMDEPTDGLDPNQKQEVRQLIASMAKDKAVILSTHILEEVSAMCNRVIIIHNGSILVDESPEKLIARHPDYNTVTIRPHKESDIASIKNDIEKLKGIEKVIIQNTNLHIYPKNKQPIKKLILNAIAEKNWEIDDISNTPLGIDKVFRNLTLERP